MSLNQNINSPDLWLKALPQTKRDAHKYDRGVAVIYGASKMTGATRLAARACARMGAGLVKVIAPEGTGDIYRSTLSEEVIVEDEGDAFGKGHALLRDPRCRALLMGPGCLPNDLYCHLFATAMAEKHVNGIIMDAGAFLSWKGHKMLDLKAFSDPTKVVVTPHEGELKAFFESYEEGAPILAKPTKAERAQAAASFIDSTIVLKGAQTVIAGADTTIMQDRDVPALATAGTGDVLAGMITGLIAQGMTAPMAAAASVWIHAEAAARFGKGMVASDLPEMFPEVLRDLKIT